MNSQGNAIGSKISKPQLSYNSVWRWHFYAGLFCIPFAIWLSITGSIYLFKPQIEAWLDREYENLEFIGQSATPTSQVSAALSALPDSVLNAYILPETPHSAIRILVGKGKDLHRVFIHPQNLKILGVVDEDLRPMQILFHLHGDLLLGDNGSILMELAASWMIVLILTGLYLWWPQKTVGMAGVLYPRLNKGSNFFWRDMHAVSGLWVSFFLLFLLVSGLPWAKSWGGTLKQLRQTELKTVVKQDWNTGRSSELAERQASNTQTVGGSSGLGDHSRHNGGEQFMLTDYSLLDKIVVKVAPLNLANPILISPPNKNNNVWSARSDSQNRPLRVNVKLDPATGEIFERKDFSQRALLDRLIGYGVAAHEGQLFGWLNQALGLFTTFSVITLATSSTILWWRRRPTGTLGAPRAINRPPLPNYLFLVILILGTLLPLLGISLLVILLLEYAVLRRIPRFSKFLGVSA
jgi:uncharacterized iron-regulated membrane protein